MTATAQGTALRCDKAGCTAAGTVEHDAWVFCAEHASGTFETAPVRAQPLRPTLVPPAPPSPGPIGLLLEQASGHGNSKVRRLAEKIEAQVADLRALITDLAEDEARRKAEEAARVKAVAEVERLEKALAAAKAALPASGRKGNTSPRTQAQLDASRRNAAVAREKAAVRRAAKEAQA